MFLKSSEKENLKEFIAIKFGLPKILQDILQAEWK